MRSLSRATCLALVASGCLSKPDGPESTCPAVLATPDLVLYLPLDETSGTAVADASPTGVTGMLFGPTWQSGRIANGLAFDGVDDYADLGSSDALDDLARLTACAWVRPTADPIASIIVDKSYDSYSGGWTLYLQHEFDGPHIGFGTNYGHWKVGSFIAPVSSSWTHVCASWDGTPGTNGIELYRNGDSDPTLKDSVVSTTGRLPDGAHPFVVGRQSNTNTFPFAGLVDEVVVYKRVLTSTEVSAIYDCAK